MASPATTINSFIKNDFKKIFGDDVSAETKIAHDDPSLIQFNRFLDSVIKIGTEKHGLSKSQSLSAANNFLNTQFTLTQKGAETLDKSLLINALTQALKEKHDEHVGHVDHSLSGKLMQSNKNLENLTSVMDKALKPDISSKKEYASASKEDVQEAFTFHMQAMGKELLELPEHERQAAMASKLTALTQSLESQYGSKKIQAFSDSVKDSQLASYTYLEQSRTGAELPEYGLGESAIEMLTQGDFSQMSGEEKIEVTNLVKSFFSNLDESGQYPEEQKIDFDLAFGKLKPLQQAFYQNTKNQASEISKIASNPSELLEKLAKKLPGSVIPGIIGAVVGYLMGFGFLGGAAGVALAALGDKVEAEADGKFDLEAKVELPKPPSYKSAIAETPLAA